MALNDEIREARKFCGWSQAKFAELAGVSIDTVRRWEAGEREPRAGELQRVAKLLGTTATELLRKEKREIRLILDKKGEMLMNMSIAATGTDKFVRVSKNGLVLHIGGPVRSENELDALLKEFKTIGLEALAQQEKWRQEDEKGRADTEGASAS